MIAKVSMFPSKKDMKLINDINHPSIIIINLNTDSSTYTKTIQPLFICHLRTNIVKDINTFSLFRVVVRK